MFLPSPDVAFFSCLSSPDTPAPVLSRDTLLLMLLFHFITLFRYYAYLISFAMFLEVRAERGADAGASAASAVAAGAAACASHIVTCTR